MKTNWEYLLILRFSSRWTLEKLNLISYITARINLFIVTFTQRLFTIPDFIVSSSLGFIFHANERDVLRCGIMHSLHRVRLATSGSLGAGSYPCYATRFGEESTLFSRNRGRRSGWLESFSRLRLTHRATRPGFHLLLPLLSFLSSSFFFRGSRAVQGQCTPSRRMSVHCCSNNERWPLLFTVVVPLPPLTYVCLLYKQPPTTTGRNNMPRHTHKLHVSQFRRRAEGSGEPLSCLKMRY